nr:DNA polymerase subunit gamma-2, mitochondrial isoform X1 [Onthophagus taurus]XP_022916849.1 DNA polymerase subunit gamma-2, mitochondrial isoform X2 [Onthophagus taurus]
MVINKDYTVFPNESNSFKKSFLYAKETCSSQFPFGIVEKILDKTSNDGFLGYFDNNEVIKCNVFVAPQLATAFYHQLQRQRRMWWRIFSASPGRYILSDIQNNDVFQSVEIKAEYPWGLELIEKINLFKNLHPELNKDLFQGSITPCYITSEISLQSMLINTLCDAYDATLHQNTSRIMFRFHRKLAPYKISFSISKSQKNASTEDLLQLAIFISKQLREHNISCLLLPKAGKDSLEEQWMFYDCLGIPYNVILTDETLKNGIVQLRSRDTTLKEQIHVGELPKYVEQLFKNY